MRQIGCGLVRNRRLWRPRLIGLCIVSLGSIVRRSRRIVIVQCVWVSSEIWAYPRKHVRNSRSVGRSVWPSIARGAGIGLASAEIAGPTSLQAAGHDGRSAAGIAGRSCESVGSRSAEASARRLCGVAREAAARCCALSAGRNSQPHDNQRDRGETLHENILRLFAYFV
jgi:hypothetical protein